MYTESISVESRQHLKNVSDLSLIAETAAKAYDGVYETKPLAIDAAMEIDSVDDTIMADVMASSNNEYQVSDGVVAKPKSDTWFPVTIVTGGGQQPTVVDPKEEKRRRQQMIAIGSIVLLLIVLLIILITKKQ